MDVLEGSGHQLWLRFYYKYVIGLFVKLYIYITYSYQKSKTILKTLPCVIYVTCETCEYYIWSCWLQLFQFANFNNYTQCKYVNSFSEKDYSYVHDLVPVQICESLTRHSIHIYTCLSLLLPYFTHKLYINHCFILYCATCNQFNALLLHTPIPSVSISWLH